MAYRRRFVSSNRADRDYYPCVLDYSRSHSNPAVPDSTAAAAGRNIHLRSRAQEHNKAARSIGHHFERLRRAECRLTSLKQDPPSFSSPSRLVKNGGVTIRTSDSTARRQTIQQGPSTIKLQSAQRSSPPPGWTPPRSRTLLMASRQSAACRRRTQSQSKHSPSVS